MKKKMLISGASGFIGRNLLLHFAKTGEYELYGIYHKTPLSPVSFGSAPVQLIEADLTRPSDVERVIRDKDILIQAAATTSGAKDIVTKPYYHVTDNAVMNSLLFRACREHKVEHVVFFSCTSMYRPQQRPVREEDFDGTIEDKYFGVGWTKVYIEKMCEFYSRIGPTRYTAVRHSNIYGPYDKFDLEKSHVFGATVTKVMTAGEGGKMTVWGDGSDERDLLYVEDLVDFVDRVLKVQKTPFELVNVGRGESISVRDLVQKIIRKSGRNLAVEFDTTKPTIGFKLRIQIDRAQRLFQWTPKTSLDEGIEKTLAWYRANLLETEVV